MKEQLKQLIQEVREDGPPSSPEWQDACDALESKLDNFSPWISVEDALPEESGRYWCFCEEQTDLGLSSYQWNYSFNLYERRWGNDGGSVVTHWMPLPQPPKSQKE